MTKPAKPQAAQSPESEDAIIACCLQWPKEAMPFCAAELRPAHFFCNGNPALWAAILGLFCSTGTVDIAGVTNALRDSDTLECVGGVVRITSLAVVSAVPSGLPQHVRRVKDEAAKRRMGSALRSMLGELDAAGTEIGPLLSQTIQKLEEIGNDRASTKNPSVKDLVMEVVARVERRFRGEEAEIGVSTGIVALDRLTGGLRKSSQWVIAAPAKCGKSSLALNFLESLAVRSGKRCAFFGLEMPSLENVERMLCCVGNVSATAMRDGKVDQQFFQRVTAASANVAKAPILFRDDVFDLTELIATVRQMKSAYPDLYAVFVDYAQLISGERNDRDAREREVATISRTLRKLSMQLGLCLVVLSQVNDDGKLRESRALGMDATKIIFIEFDDNPNVRKLKLVQRDGVSGVELKVAYRGDHFQFGDLADDENETHANQRNDHRHAGKNNGSGGNQRSHTQREMPMRRDVDG